MSRRAAKPIALILCGGAGARMAPWSDARHKCLVAVDQDGKPLFARHVERLRAHGFCVHANVGEKWAGAFRDVARGLKVPVEVIPEGGEPNGSGTTLLRLARANPRARAYAVVCGDVWYSDEWYLDLREMAEFVKTCVGVIATEPDPDERGGPGLVELDGCPLTSEFGQFIGVRRVCESPCRQWPSGAVQAAGMMVWSRAAIDSVAGKFGKRLGIDMMRDMLPKALRSRVSVVARVCARAGIADVGTPLRYARHVAQQYEEHGRTRLGEDAADGIVALLTARRILAAGNGGACAVAQHAAIDWQKAGGRDVIALADHVVNSAWANDCGYEGAISRQVELVRDPSDAALIIFTASGESANVVEAARRAREMGFHAVVAVSNSDGTAPIYKHATHYVKLPFGLPRSVQEYGAIEDAMQAWAHAATAVMSGLAPWRSCMAESGT